MISCVIVEYGLWIRLSYPCGSKGILGIFPLLIQWPGDKQEIMIAIYLDPAQDHVLFLFIRKELLDIRKPHFQLVHPSRDFPVRSVQIFADFHGEFID